MGLGCYNKAFEDVPKDEIFNLDAKLKQCIFIGYGQDEFGYKLYDPIGKRLIRSHDVVFMKDQTIEDIDKMEKTTNLRKITCCLMLIQFGYLILFQILLMTMFRTESQIIMLVINSLMISQIF